MKRLNQKGFTLAELLIVVAIIAVLVAIAIPVFNSQLEKARESTDAANVRDVYAEISVAMLDGGLVATNDEITVLGNKKAKLTLSSEGVPSVTVANVELNQKIADWQTGSVLVAGATIAAPTTTQISAKKADITFTFAKETNGTTGAVRNYLSGVAYSDSSAGG